jgi:succinoglycan biosynthesis protein ExoO
MDENLTIAGISDQDDFYVPRQVSILMAAFNAERYIQDAIESCLRQTTSDWELVIVNDASTDKTLEVAAQFDDPRIRLITLEKNSGPGAARNAALSVATGEWITTLDADDGFEPGRLEVLRRFGEKSGPNFVYLDELHDWEIERMYPSNFKSSDPNLISTKELTLAEWIDCGRGGKPFFHRNLVCGQQIAYPCEVRGTEDFVFMCRLVALTGATIVQIDSRSYLYRRTPGSLVSARQKQISEVLRAIAIIRQEEIEYSVSDALIRLEAWFLREKLFLEFKKLVKEKNFRRSIQVLFKHASIRKMLLRRLFESCIARLSIRIRAHRQEKYAPSHGQK